MQSQTELKLQVVPRNHLQGTPLDLSTSSKIKPLDLTYKDVVPFDLSVCKFKRMDFPSIDVTQTFFPSSNIRLPPLDLSNTSVAPLDLSKSNIDVNSTPATEEHRQGYTFSNQMVLINGSNESELLPSDLSSASSLSPLHYCQCKGHLNNRQRLNTPYNLHNLQHNDENGYTFNLYYPVRRRVRKTKRTVLEGRQRSLEEAVLANQDEGLEVKMFEGKGRGVVATHHFTQGEFVVEYAGELITMEQATQREQVYALDQNIGCYMFYFQSENIQYCIDATCESGRLGRLVNHSRNGNLKTKTVTIGMDPHLVLMAKKDIQSGEEITFDYGDRSQISLQHHPWLAT